jgi:hypothetical protein
LLPEEDHKSQHKFEDNQHSIVPKEDGISTPSVINARFQLHHVQANTRKIYVRDFAHHLQGMLEDSGYKFSEEYEVSCTALVYIQTSSSKSVGRVWCSADPHYCIT